MTEEVILPLSRLTALATGVHVDLWKPHHQRNRTLASCFTGTPRAPDQS